MEMERQDTPHAELDVRKLSCEALLQPHEQESNGDLERNTRPEHGRINNHVNNVTSGVHRRYLSIFYHTVLILLALLGLADIITGRDLLLSLSERNKDAFKISYNEQGAVKFDKSPCDCGGSVAEAISNGCKYDELSPAWLPERCRDDQLTAEFVAHGDGPDGRWLYWRDKQQTIPLTVEEASRYADMQPNRYYMSHEWHVWHCLYLWLKEHRFKINGKYFDPRYDSDGHITHCMVVLTTNLTNIHTSAGASLEG